MTARARRDQIVAFLRQGDLAARSPRSPRLGTRKPWRGRGIASALLRRAFAEMASAGHREVTLWVDAENETARSTSTNASGCARSSSTTPTSSSSRERSSRLSVEARGARRRRCGRSALPRGRRGAYSVRRSPVAHGRRVLAERSGRPADHDPAGLLGRGGLAASADLEAIDRSKEIGAFARVHPGHRGRGLGTAVLGWTEAAAAASIAPDATVSLHHTIAAADGAARELLSDRGYQHVRTAWHMRMDLPTAYWVRPGPAWGHADPPFHRGGRRCRDLGNDGERLPHALRLSARRSGALVGQHAARWALRAVPDACRNA